MGSSYAQDFARANAQYDNRAESFDSAYRALEKVAESLAELAREEGQYDNAADTGQAVGYIHSALMLLREVRKPEEIK